MHFSAFIIHAKERHSVFSASADPHLQMQVTPRCPPSMPDISDNLSDLHLLTGSDTDAGTVCVQRFQPAAMVDLDVVAVTAAPAVKTVGNGDDAVCGGEDRRTLGTGNVCASVRTDLAGDGVNAVSELRGNRTRNRQRPLQGACRCAGAHSEVSEDSLTFSLHTLQVNRHNLLPLPSLLYPWNQSSYL